MRASLFFIILFFSISVHAQYAFELEVDYSAQIQNSENYSVSGKLLKGKIENGKTYFLESGAKLDIINIISSTTGTSINIAEAPQAVSIGFKSKDYEPKQHVKINGISTKPEQRGFVVKTYADKIDEGSLKCNVNGMSFVAKQISKPILTKQSDILDMFFKGSYDRIIWLQVYNFSKIKMAPQELNLIEDTAKAYCKIKFLPKGFLPTDFPNNLKAFENGIDNAGIVITKYLDYNKEIGLEFNGILKPNKLIVTENPEAGLFYITEGRIDKIIFEAH